MMPLLKRLFRDPQFPHEGRALDIGFGGGEATLSLAEHGLYVDAIDTDEEKVRMLAHKIEQEGVQNVGAIVADIRAFTIEPNTYACIHANNVFPFISSKQEVAQRIEKLLGGLTQGGFLLFSLFGPRDAWGTKEHMSFFEYDEARELIQKIGGDVYFQSTEEGFGPTMAGEIKYWHIHRFVVRKM